MFYGTTDLTKVITGVRRCGKSSLMQMIKEELKTSSIKDEQIIYIDLDSRKNRNIKTSDELEKLIDDLSISEEKKFIY